MIFELDCGSFNNYVLRHERHEVNLTVGKNLNNSFFGDFLCMLTYVLFQVDAGRL